VCKGLVGLDESLCPGNAMKRRSEAEDCAAKIVWATLLSKPAFQMRILGTLNQTAQGAQNSEFNSKIINKTNVELKSIYRGNEKLTGKQIGNSRALSSTTDFICRTTVLLPESCR
jgi:hypothetical protein